MPSAISTSLSGLQSATQRLNIAAENIVTSGAPRSSDQDSLVRQVNKTAQNSRPIQANFNPQPDLVSSLIDLKLAEISYKSSAKALSVALDVEKNLIDEIK